MYISCSLLNFVREKWPTLGDTLRAARGQGFNAVDLTCLGDFHGLNPADLEEPARVREAASQVSDSGLKVVSLNSSAVAELPAGTPVAVELCRRRSAALIELARAVGCGNVTSGIMASGADRPEETAARIENLRRHLPQFGEMFRQAGVSLSLENHLDTCMEDPQAAGRLLKELHPAVSLTYDPSHLAAQGLPLDQSAYLLDYTVHCHARSARPGHMQAHLVQNTVDFHWMVGELRKRGYRGAVAIEFFGEYAADLSNLRLLRDELVRLGVGGEAPGA